MREEELAQPVGRWLEAQGFTVWSEVPFTGSIDLVGRNDKRELVMVELKKSFSRSLVYQCMHRVGIFDKVYAAAPTEPKEESLQRLVNRGIGVLRINGDNVEVLHEYTMPVDLSGFRDRVHRSLDRLSPGIYGGMAMLKGTGPAQWVYREVEKYREEHPGAKWKEIWLNVSNHYASPSSLSQSMRKVEERKEINRRKQLAEQNKSCN